MKVKLTSWRTEGALTLGSGAVALALLYLGWGGHWGPCLLLLPVLLAAWRWGWRGGVAAALILLAAALPALALRGDARQAQLWNRVTLAVLLLSAGAVMGSWVEGRRERARRTAAMEALGERLAAAGDTRTVWHESLAELVRICHADGGAWVWEQPTDEFWATGKPALEAAAWQRLAGAAALRSSPLSRDPLLQTLQLRDAIRLPVAAESWVGQLALVRRRARFSTGEKELARSLLTLVQQAALGQARYARADKVLVRQLRELELLQRLDRLVNESLDLDETLQAVLEALAELVPYDVAEITYWDEEQELLVRGALLGNTRARAMLEQIEGKYRLEEGLSGWLAQHRQPLLVADLRESAEIRPKAATDIQLRSYLGLPLLTRGELVGTLEVSAFEPGHFSAHDLELLQGLGAQAALAIEKARLYSTMQQRVQILEQLGDIARATGRAGDLSTLFSEIVTRVSEIIDVEVVGILLYDAEHRSLVARAPFLGVPDLWLQNYVISLAEDSAHTEAFWQSPYWLIEDAHSDPHIEALGLLPLALATGIRQTLFVPLQAGGERIGLVQVGNPRRGRRFTEADVQLLRMLTSQLSGMVRISQLLERMEVRTQQMTSLVSVASAIGSSLDLDAVLAEIVQAVAQVLKCKRTAIFVLDALHNTLNLAAAVGVSEKYREISQAVPVELGGRTHAVAANEIVVVEDTLSQARFNTSQLTSTEGLRAFVDLPLCRDEKPLGMLTVQFLEAHRFTTDELHLLTVLAEQAAVAIENARRYGATDEELRRRVRALESLQQVTREILSTLDLDHILQLVLQEALRFGEATAGGVLLWDGVSLELRAAQGYDEADLAQLREHLTHAENLDLLKSLAQQPDPLYFPDLVEQPETALTFLEARSLLLAPIFYEGELAAVLLLQSAAPQAFPPAAREFATGLAMQTAIAVGNARRYEEQLARGELMYQRFEQIRLLLEVARTMRSDRPLEDTLLDMAYATQEAIGYQTVLISVLEGQLTRRVAGAGIPLTDLEEMKKERTPWTLISSLLQERFRMGQCYYIPAEHQALWRGELTVFEAEKGEAQRVPGMWHPQDILLAPLYNPRGEVLGYMSVDAPHDGRAPTRASLEVLELFAAQIALAVENHRLVESLQLQLNTVSLFNELNRSITAKLDLPLVLNTVVQSVTNLLNYDYATIFLQERESQQFTPRASSGYELKVAQSLSSAADEGLIGAVVQTGMPLVLDDVQADPRYKPVDIPLGSSLMVPLMAEGRTVGVLTADRKARGEFSPTEVATLMALADQVSVAVENARLFEEVRDLSEYLEQRVEERTAELGEALGSLRVERDRAGLLYRIASELVASLDIDRVLHQSLAILSDATHATRGSILLLDSNTGHLYYRAATGSSREALPPGGMLSTLNRDTGLIGWVLKNRQSANIPDVRQDERWLLREADTTRALLAVPILSPSGEPLGAIFLHADAESAFDENDRRLVEAAAVQVGNALNNAELYRLIREQTERLGTMLRTQQVEAVKNQAILEGIADGVMVADAEGQVILFNAAAEQILSVTREQAIGRHLDEMLGLYGLKGQDWLQQVRQWQKTPESYASGRFLAERLNLEQRVVSVHLSPVVSQAYEFLGIVSVFRDVTAEVEADRAKSDFVSTVSHELRTPMTAVKGYVDLLLMGTTGPLNEMQTHFLNVVKANSDRLASLVNDLLDISRIETGKIVLDLQPVDMKDLVEQVVLTMTPKAEEKGLHIDYVLPPVLPRAYGDPARLTQILTNLVGNAYKYTPPGGEVSIHAYVVNGMFHVAVADTGIGVSSEDQRKIFERFYRVDDPLVQDVAGTGLGLAITLSLIHELGGNILVESELGEGSIFTFTIPLAEDEATEAVGRPPEGFALVSPPTVLVVEGDQEIADLLRITLEKEGCRVLLAKSGEEALHTAREQHPDLISLDIRLPDLDGFDVLRLLKRGSQTADIPVMLLSVLPDLERGLQMGAEACLPKPLDMEHLLEVVDRILSGKGTVLVVEADKQVLVVLREALRMHGVHVRTTGRGERALRLAHELYPSLILLDFDLPDISGMRVLEKLRQDRRTKNVPVIVIGESEDVAAGVSEEIAAAGSLRFLTKPLSVEELAGEISHLVNGKDGLHKEQQYD